MSHCPVVRYVLGVALNPEVLGAAYARATAREPCRIALGPNLVPLLYDVAVSKGTPTINMSSEVPLSNRHFLCARRWKVVTPLKAYSAWASRSNAEAGHQQTRLSTTEEDRVFCVGLANTSQMAQAIDRVRKKFIV